MEKILTYFHFGIIKGLWTIYSRVCSSSCPLLPPAQSSQGSLFQWEPSHPSPSSLQSLWLKIQPAIIAGRGWDRPPSQAHWTTLLALFNPPLLWFTLKKKKPKTKTPPKNQTNFNRVRALLQPGAMLRPKRLWWNRPQNRVKANCAEELFI